MAKYGSDQVAFWLVDGYSILGVVSELTLDGPEAMLEETHALGDGWIEQDPTGLKRWAADQNGWFDDATDGVLDALAGNEGTSRVACLGVEGNSVGAALEGFAGAMGARVMKQPRRNELTKLQANFQGSGQYDHGVILHELSAETADGDTESSPVDNSASSAAGGAGYLQVTDLTLGGYTSVTVTLRDSSDDITYADLGSFTAVTAAPDAERIVVAGTVERYLAVAWAFNGTGASPSVTFMAGFARF